MLNVNQLKIAGQNLGQIFNPECGCACLCHATEQHTLKDANHGWNTNIYSYLETSGGKSYNLY